MLFMLLLLLFLLLLLLLLLFINNIYINFIQILIKRLKTLLIISILLRNKGESNAQGFYPND